MAQRRAHGPTHAGCVAFRVAGAQPRYLLVEARRRPHDWVFPKGHVEAGETLAETALREAQEEAGIAGSIRGELGVEEFEVRGERLRVAWLLVEVVEERPSPEARRKQWCTLAEALAAVAHEGQRNLLRRAHERVGTLPPRG